MKLPVYYHYFRSPLPYGPTLALQEKIHAIQLANRRSSLPYKDILLLLQHRPVYTPGRRQSEDSVYDERLKLTRLGADFVTATRGGLLTYHGPGQLVGYPLIDLSRFTPTMGVRDYVCRMQKSLERYLQEAHGIGSIPSEHTGVFLSATTKIASIGVHVRHRLTTHGFAMNVTKEPLSWFDQIVACGLDNVKATSIETAKRGEVTMEEVVGPLITTMGRIYEREMIELDISGGGLVEEAIQELEKIAEEAGAWKTEPIAMMERRGSDLSKDLSPRVRVP
ncbi:hypothetical protein F5887DRAFT_401663 [Amanita rubescens]|nr:hypothetical protein F5887DRAFT_401663 [Amanita rubescens]